VEETDRERERDREEHIKGVRDREEHIKGVRDRAWERTRNSVG
jgi:hypothetical protein